MDTNLNNPAAIEQELIRIQQSTRTSFPLFIRMHDWLRMHSRFYYRWHTFKYIRLVHILVLMLYTVGVIVYSYYLFNPAQKIVTTIPVQNSVADLSEPIIASASSAGILWAIPVLVMFVSLGMIVMITVAIIRAKREAIDLDDSSQ